MLPLSAAAYTGEEIKDHLLREQFSTWGKGMVQCELWPTLTK